jgi:hypothetical protein
MHGTIDAKLCFLASKQFYVKRQAATDPKLTFMVNGVTRSNLYFSTRRPCFSWRLASPWRFVGCLARLAP